MHSRLTKFVECVDIEKKVCYHGCTLQLKKKNAFLSFADRRSNEALLSDLWLSSLFGYIVINGPLLYTPGGFARRGLRFWQKILQFMTENQLVVTISWTKRAQDGIVETSKNLRMVLRTLPIQVDLPQSGS